jgi:hypothetical protein
MLRICRQLSLTRRIFRSRIALLHLHALSGKFSGAVRTAKKAGKASGKNPSVSVRCRSVLFHNSVLFPNSIVGGAGNDRFRNRGVPKTVDSVALFVAATLS